MDNNAKTQELRLSALARPAGDLLLLLCAVPGLLRSFLSLYNYADSTIMIVVSYIPPGLAFCDWRLLTKLAVLFALAALLIWSLPRFRWAAASVSLAAILVITFRHRAEVVLGAKLTFQQAADLVIQQMAWDVTVDFGVSLSWDERTAVTLFLALMLAALALLIGWAVVRARRWWVVLLFTMPFLLPGLIADLYPDWPAFLLLAACWCAMLLTDLCRRANPAARGRLTLVVLPCVVLLLAVLSLAVPREGYSRPQWALKAEQLLVDFGNRNFSFFSKWKGPFHTASYVGAAEKIDLASAGPLRYTGRTVLKVSGDFSRKVYLRGASLAHYENNHWEPLSSPEYAEYTDALEEAGYQHVSPLLFSSYVTYGQYTRTVTVENFSASASCVYAPYYLAQQDWESAGVQPVDDSVLAGRRSESSHTFSVIPTLDLNNARGSLTAPVEDTDDQLTPYSHVLTYGLDILYRDFVREHYLDVPEEFAEYIESLSGIEEALSSYLDEYLWPQLQNPALAANAVADYLADLCEYDPNTPAVPDGEDFVLYFLTESHRGYCMHFASAAVLLLRQLGIPARYVSGFTAELSAGETVNVPDSAAHAWVEIYLDGFGWYPVEVTPSYTPPEPDESDAPSATPSAALPSATPSAEPTPSIAPSAEPSASQAVTSQTPAASGGFARFVRGLLKILAALATAAAAVAVLWLGQALPKRHRAGRLADEDTNAAVLYGYRCLERLQKWGGSIPEPALELARKARFSQYAMSGDERSAMAAIVDSQRLWLRDSLPRFRRALFHYLWGWPAQPTKENVPDDHP